MMNPERADGYVSTFLQFITGEAGGMMSLGIFIGMGVTVFLMNKYIVPAKMGELIAEMKNLTEKIVELEERLLPYEEFEREVVAQRLSEAAS